MRNREDGSLARSLARCVSAISLFALTLAAECSPTPPSCADPHDGECPAGEHRHCIDFCIELGTLGASCGLDPCNLGAGETICHSAYSCVDGECVTTASPPLLGCHPAFGFGNTDSCGSGTYCQGTACGAPFEATLPPWLGGDVDGYCRAPAREGERCDGDWQELVDWSRPPDEICRPCEPGTACEPAPWNSSQRVCQRPCETSQDCPCGGVPSGYAGCLPSGYCDVCFATGAECDPMGPECCDSGATCEDEVVLSAEVDGELVEVNLGPRCCRAEGEDCSPNHQCCSGNVCSLGQCSACTAIPGGAVDSGGCCPPLVVRSFPGMNPFCGMPCPLAEAGEVALVPGPCGASEHPFVCDPVLGDVPPTIDFAEPGTPCARATNLIGCGVETDYTVPGTWECRNERTECIAWEGEDYCNGPDTGSGCGQGFPFHCPSNYLQTIRCTSDSVCAPGYYCREFTTYDAVEEEDITIGSYCAPCLDGIDYPLCWTPGTEGGCIGAMSPATPSCEL